MKQEQLKEQATSYIYNNLNEETQQELLIDLINEMKLMDQLKLTNVIIENLLMATCYNLETTQDKNSYNKLCAINLTLSEIIKDNKGE